MHLRVIENPRILLPRAHTTLCAQLERRRGLPVVFLESLFWRLRAVIA